MESYSMLITIYSTKSSLKFKNKDAFRVREYASIGSYPSRDAVCRRGKPA